MERKKFLSLSALAAGTSLSSGFNFISPVSHTQKLGLSEQDIIPISLEERKQRVAKAQRLLVKNNMAALVIEGGSTLNYFTGIKWWISERTMVAVIPASGDIFYICPGFEEQRFREILTVGDKVYTWQEDESPYEKVALAFGHAGINHGKIGIEEQVRFFISDGLRKAAPHLDYVSGDPVTIPCRMFKSPAELALMQRASDITVAAMKKGISHLKEGISADEISGVIDQAHRDLGGTPDFALVLFGANSALPHGTVKPQYLKKGDIVLMDCGCTVEGYNSDITRTIVFGATPSQRQLDIWQLEQKSQSAGFAAARLGSPCERVDAAARKVITDAGFGPGYKLPGLPHRTGHGIGMDGHEWGNMVKGNQLLLAPGMCFSIEPTLSIPGEFGVRMEDCVYMTETGPAWFSQPAVAIDKPFG